MDSAEARAGLSHGVRQATIRYDRELRSQGLRKFYEDGERKLLRPDLVDRVATLLSYLDAAQAIEDLDLPSLRLHPLKGELKGSWAITVRANWRIVFRFADGKAAAVDLIDYH